MENTDIYFIITILTLVIGLIQYSIKECHKNRCMCSHCNLCYGLLSISRRSSREIQQEDLNIDNTCNSV